MRHIIIRVVELTGYAGVRHVAVSLAHVPALIDGKKYLEPGDVKQPHDNTQLRRQRAPRGPTLRSLAKLALQSATNSGRRSGRRIGLPPEGPARQPR